MKIGFIGMGIMGAPMAQNLLKAGFSVMVYNRTAEKCKPLVDAGASQARSPREIAEKNDVIITIVSDTPDVEAVLFGEGGVWQGLSKGKVVIDMSTISPDATVGFAKRLAEKGCEMLDAPVSGGQKGAIDGTLAIMVGGKKEVFDRCRAIFDAMGKTIVYLGPNGSGQKTKMVNQVIAALHLLAMSEGLVLAKKAGLDPETVLKVVSSGAAGSWMLSNLAQRILKNDFAPGFFIYLQAKDLRIAREFMEKLDVRFPGTELTYQLFNKAVEKGLGEQGTQGLINLFDWRG